VPESLQGVQWVETPQDFQVMSDAYRAALELNEARAKDIGVEVFPAQWTLWDRIRQRVEPHEAMFPGLEKLPALNDQQLIKAFAANKAAGYMTTPEQGKTWRRQSGISPASLAYFTPAELPENKYYLFGKDGGKQLAEKYAVPFLGEVPLIQAIREAGDDGKPIASTEGPSADAFASIAANLAQQVAISNAKNQAS
jgi:hypothetical protein